MKKFIIWLPMIVIVTMIMTVATASVLNVETVQATKYGIQINFEDGTGYWIGK